MYPSNRSCHFVPGQSWTVNSAFNSITIATAASSRMGAEWQACATWGSTKTCPIFRLRAYCNLDESNMTCISLHHINIKQTRRTSFQSIHV